MSFRKFDPSSLPRKEMAVIAVVIVGLLVTWFALQMLSTRNSEWNPQIGIMNDSNAKPTRIKPTESPDFNQSDRPRINVASDRGFDMDGNSSVNERLLGMPEYLDIVNNRKFKNDAKLATALMMKAAENSRAFSHPGISAKEAFKLAEEAQLNGACARTLFGTDGLAMLMAQRKIVRDTAARKYHALMNSKHMAFKEFPSKEVDREFCETYLGVR